MTLHVSIPDPTPGCPTCDDSRASSLRWGGRGWIPVRCPDCCPHNRADRHSTECPDCGIEIAVCEMPEVS
jgi:hypothetical protein